MQKHLQKTLQTQSLLQSANRIWIGFSGGVDSTVLLHSLATEPTLKNKLQALHIHHGLSPHADDWAKHCKSVCSDHGVPFQMERVMLREKGSLEQQARFARCVLGCQKSGCTNIKIAIVTHHVIALTHPVRHQSFKLDFVAFCFFFFCSERRTTHPLVAVSLDQMGVQGLEKYKTIHNFENDVTMLH